MSRDDELIDRSVAAVDRTLLLLEAFLGKPGTRSLSDLEAQTGLFKSVILRYMLSLEARGFVHKEANGAYRLGVKASQLGKAFDGGIDLVATLRPIVDRLMHTTGHSASVYVRDGDARACLVRAEPDRVVRVSIRAGTRRPIDKTASGQAFARFENRTAAALANKGVENVSASSGVGDPLLASMAMPLFGVDDAFVGVLTLSGVIGDFDVDDRKLRAALYEEASNASALLGATLPAQPVTRKAAGRRRSAST
ncbi:IclR family transcriptional regulator [Trinickia diaoshuihuensis]|uniref:IclR family transcriptional regulator n=1 Tax=Trinickia diaoshuihuensis TaxID=2292265 RepID=UPI000E260919|nr:helix-turn-helix domain-containing protein [Trinickia diaoshuihuensis]